MKPRISNYGLLYLYLALLLLTAVAAGINLQGQPADNPRGIDHAQNTFYRPLRFAPADEPAEGGADGQAEEYEAKGGLSAEELAKIAQNPVVNMISIPFQNNFYAMSLAFRRIKTVPSRGWL
ncbi:MAG: hypothetical protein NT154_38475 [Verrucomicrobia bacterium]|nr:hypothetical protein [Verrucomicrobiota bacterium]